MNKKKILPIICLLVTTLFFCSSSIVFSEDLCNTNNTGCVFNKFDSAVTCGAAFGDNPIPVLYKEACDQENLEDNQKILISDLFNRVIELMESADNQDELQSLLENDPIYREIISVLEFETIAIAMDDKQCFPTLALCFWDPYYDDLGCKNNCFGFFGPFELVKMATGFCGRISVCILFKNCLAICRTIL